MKTVSKNVIVDLVVRVCECCIESGCATIIL